MLITNSDFDIFEVIASMCFDHVKGSSRCNPKNFIDSSFSPNKIYFNIIHRYTVIS